ncbi:WXG100 family type VII secretion target [Sphaerisporangium fuscum]|uniref:WXG100 family type VII secretion target n=1 Tax=Sphaerisporangium fuscum TaxID=2835868 RepID=UPI001BDD8E34|nr:WXG100 family type VII secretion target [Sphaerisporangium fuscum]
MAQEQISNAQFSKLKEAAGRTGEAHSLIEGIRTMLISHTAELRAGWGGSSGMAFGDEHTGAFGAWNGELQNVLKELKTLEDKLHKVEAHYRTNEQDREQRARQLSSNISGAGRLSASING